MENFTDEDYQFKGKLFKSGYKVYHEEGNHLKQKYLLFECRANEKIWCDPLTHTENQHEKKNKHSNKWCEVQANSDHIFDS